MAPEHLLATSAKLCAEILAAAADGLLNLDDNGSQCVLQDALQILACKEMHIQANRLGGGAENMQLEEESGAAAFAAAKRRVVTQIAKKKLIQNAIPIFIELKRLLESKNSSLIGCLTDCLRMILKEYKNEIDEILVADQQLQKELVYDIQKYESSKTKSQGASAVSLCKILYLEMCRVYQITAFKRVTIRLQNCLTRLLHLLRLAMEMSKEKKILTSMVLL